jgi:cysteinyl-tRNA synthetase
MAGKYLGDAFDIHGGGLDLRFPHHENELAQSRAAGRPFATYWMHNAWVTLAGEKMSKSLGNTADVLSAVERHGGRAIRLYLAGPHYRSSIELSDASLAEAAAQLARIDSFLDRAGRVVGPAEVADLGPAAIPAAFAEAMDDDLGTPGALAVLFGTIREGNSAIDAEKPEAVIAAHTAVRVMLGVLGLDPAGPEWAHEHTTGGDLTPVVDGLVAALLEQRTQARARKDWPAADAIRDQLATIGLKVEDTPTGPRWSLEN